jgi:hypothetical protein
MLPFVASLIVAAFYAFNFGEPFNDVMKTSLNDYVDWDNSIHIVGPNNGVNKDLKKCVFKNNFRPCGLYHFLA